MARCRNLKPGFFTNEALAELPALTRLLFAGLWTSADRAGRLEDRPKRIKAEIMPYDTYDVDTGLAELADGSDPFIVRYEAEGRRYIQVRNFPKHQSPHHTEKPSVIPEPPLDNGRDTAVELAEHYPHVGSEVDGSEGGEREGKSKRTRFVVPSIDQVAAYCVERKNGIDAAHFVDHYATRGWVLSNGRKMVDWQAAVRTWEKNGFQHGGSSAKPVAREYRQIPLDQFNAHAAANEFKVGPHKDVPKLGSKYARVSGQLSSGRKVESHTDPNWKPEN